MPGSDSWFAPALRAALAVGILGVLALSAFVVPGPDRPAAAPAPSGLGAEPLRTGLTPATSPIPPGAAGKLTALNAVDPYSHYTSEPAPLGVADFGVAANGSPYSYTTTTFVGVAQMTSFVTYNRNLTSFGVGQNDEMTLQLNVLLYFSSGGHAYAFWIQDVLDLRTLNRTTQFEDNIWNMTAGSSGLVESTTVTGNGSFTDFGGGAGLYVDVAGAQPGNAVDLNRSNTVELRVVSSVANGTPIVAFDYLDGFGWQTFDRASFSFTHSVANASFRVDGGSYVLGSLYDDAELVFGGPGGGSTTRIISGAANLSLYFDNGHDLEAVPNAYNFGSDTGETVSHGTGALGPGVAGHAPSATLVPGNGGLAALYNASGWARLVVRSPEFVQAAVALEGEVTLFRGGSADLAVIPGTASIALLNGSFAVDSGNVSTVAGATTYLALPYPRMNVSFREHGLPSGTPWSVEFAGQAFAGSGAAFVGTVKNGTWGYRLGPVPGFTTPSWAGTVVVNGSDVVVPVAFQPFVYGVEFVESDLPTGSAWSVTFAGVTRTGSSTDIGFAAGNGTYNFSVSASFVYVGQPDTGTVLVAAASAQQSVFFTLRPGTLAGTVTPSDSAVLLQGGALSVRGGQFEANLTPGTYQLEAIHPGYVAQFQNVTVTAGNLSPARFELHPVPAASTAGAPASALEWVVGVAVAAVAVGAAAVLAQRRAGRAR